MFVDSCVVISNFSVEKLIEEIDRLKIEKLAKENVNSEFNISLKCKQHINKYLSEYLFDDSIGVKTAVIEKNYMDKYYWEDFCQFYSKCFSNYYKDCIRIHFFAIDFNEDNFKKLISGDLNPVDSDGNELTAKTLQDERKYIGFMVVKPLPETVIGRTCLITYSDSVPGRCYPILTKNNSNLFGISLNVQTLAFQEQDKNVGACATAALWSLLMGTAVSFQHRALSPIEITKKATEIFHYADKTFPNDDGLNGIQKSAVIRSVGLENFYSKIDDMDRFKNIIYAYLKNGFPIIIQIALFEKHDTDKTNECSIEFLGYHAITVTGFRVSVDDEMTDFVSTKMVKIYAHDDQIGPFARMEIIKQDNEMRIIRNSKTSSDIYKFRRYNYYLSSSRGDNFLAFPTYSLIPVSDDIRIRFEKVNRFIESFQKLYNKTIIAKNLEGFTHPNMIHGGQIEWDIYLSSIQDFKTDLFDDNELTHLEKERILTANMPRFIWLAIAKNKETRNKLFILLFDPTDIDQGSCLHDIIVYDCDFYNFIKQIISEALIAVKDDENNKFPLKFEIMLKKMICVGAN